MSDVPTPVPPPESSITTPEPFPPPAWPDPAQPGVRPPRPSVITVLGVMSLVAALVGIAGAAGTAMWAFAFYASAHAASAAAAREAALRRSPLFAPEPPPVVVEPGPDGLAGPLRGGIVDAFNAVRPLRPQRVEQLDAILARSGRSILLSAEDRRAGLEPSPARVRDLVLDHGELFSANRAAAPEYFRLDTGRLEVYDDRAVFYPADGTRALRSSLPRPATRPAPAQASAPAPPPNPSTPALVTVLVATLAGAALSVLLFVAAVLWLRGMPSGRRLHLLWAWLKVAVVVAAAVPFWWMTRGFQRDFRSYLGVALPDVGTTPRRTIVQPWQPLAAGAAGLLYPVVVLTVLRSRTTRDYFRREDEA